MTSLWQLTAPWIPSDEFAGADGPDGGSARCDTVIVGAGLTGLVTGVLLARAGQRVTVLEARTTGAVTTGNTTGKLSLLQGTVLGELRDYAGDEVLRAYVEANREGQAWLVRELESRGEQVERRPAFTYASDESQLELLEREREASAVAGLQISETTETGLPFESHGALTMEAQVQLQPMVVLARLAEELRERGGRLVEHCRVVEVEPEEHRLRIVTERGSLFAERCVLATGAPILDRGMFFAKLQPSRSFVTAYRLLDAHAPKGMYVAAGEPMHSLRTAYDAVGEEVLVVGGGARIVGAPGDSREELRALDSWTARHFPNTQRLAWWAAQDYRSHSRVPFAGEMPRGGGRIYAATGYNKWGMTNAVAAALAIVGEMLGGHMEWARTLNQSGTSLAEISEALGATAAVAGRLISGWTAAELRSIDSMQLPAEGEGFVARDGVEPVAISRVDGELCRVSGVCTHLGGILRWNSAERSWDCPLHGSRFAADGTRLEGPGLRDLPPAA